jgi:hypothetical protein
MTPEIFLFTVWSAIFFAATFAFLSGLAQSFGWKNVVSAISGIFLICALVGLTVYTVAFLANSMIV